MAEHPDSQQNDDEAQAGEEAPPTAEGREEAGEVTEELKRREDEIEDSEE